MMGFPLQLPIDAMAARAVELTDWQGDIAGAGDHRGKALVIAVKSEAEAKALAAWISGIPVAVTVQKEQEKLHAAPFAVAGITPEMIADLIASLRDGAFELPAAMRDKSWAKESADQIMAVAANVIEQLEAALTRANAATAAAFEVAAMQADEAEVSTWEFIAPAIRDLATPDQTAAMDRMIAEAVADKDGEIAQLNQDLDDMRDNAESAYRRGYWAGGNGA